MIVILCENFWNCELYYDCKLYSYDLYYFVAWKNHWVSSFCGVYQHSYIFNSIVSQETEDELNSSFDKTLHVLTLQITPLLVTLKKKVVDYLSQWFSTFLLLRPFQQIQLDNSSKTWRAAQ